MLGCFIIKYILESRDRKLMKAIDSKKFLDIKDIKIKSVETIGNIGLEKIVYFYLTQTGTIVKVKCA